MSEKAKRLAREFLKLSSVEQKEVIQLIRPISGGKQRSIAGNRVSGEVNSINFAPPGGRGRCPRCGK